MVLSLVQLLIQKNKMKIGNKYIKRFVYDNDYYQTGSQLLSINDNDEIDNIKRSFKKLLSFTDKKFYKTLNWEKPKWKKKK